jgi:cytochrome c peroxidase
VKVVIKLSELRVKNRTPITRKAALIMKKFLSIMGLFCLLTQTQVMAQGPNRLENLGHQIFNDRALSEPRGTSCADCHVAKL